MPGHLRERAPARRAALAVLTLSAACSSPEPPSPEPIRPVRYQVARSTGGDRVRSFSGSAHASTEATLSFRVAGIIREIAVQVGDRVARGDLIARLDPTDYLLAVQQAELSVIRASAEARNAAANYDRARQLYENNNAALTDLDAAKAAAESTTAARGSAEKTLELLRQQLSYATLRAPLAGAIAAVPVEVNENIATGQAIAIMTSGLRSEVVVTMPELLIGGVEKGMAVAVRVDALPGRTFAATVTEVGVMAASMHTAFPVTVLLDDANAAVRPGMAADVAFTFPGAADSALMVVPAVAVVEDRAGRRFVWIVEPTGDDLGRIARRDVTVGDITSAGLEVTAGLAEGDRVVTVGVSKLRDGMTVKVPAEAPAT